MFEALRKLTANYTEAEYEAWLMEDYLLDEHDEYDPFAGETETEEEDGE